MSQDHNKSLTTAAQMGYSVQVQHFIPLAEPKAITWALANAVQQGHYECVQLLIDALVGIEDLDDGQLNDVLCNAVDIGDVDAVNILLQRCHPSYDSSRALWHAVCKEDIDLVQLLLPMSDPKSNNSDCLQRASQHQHQEIFDLVYPLSDPQTALEHMIKFNASDEEKHMLQTRIQAEQERKIISNSVKTSHIPSTKSKM